MTEIDVHGDNDRKLTIEFRGASYALLQYLALQYRKPKAEIVKDGVALVKEAFEVEDAGGALMVQYADGTLVKLTLIRGQQQNA